MINKNVLIFAGSLAITIAVLGIFLPISLVRNSNKELDKVLTESLEKAYFEGHRAAIEGDIHIKMTEDGYVWIKSPWTNGQEPIYIPGED